MKLSLIAPAMPGGHRFRNKVLVPPLGLAMVAALTPPDVDVSLIDENVGGATRSQGMPDLVGITTQTTTAQRAYEIADRFRSKGVKVVLGGVHASFLPDEACQHADAVVIGEAEDTWPRLIDDIRKDRLQQVYADRRRSHLVGLPIPRRELYAQGAYWVKNTLSATRGCPYSCSFCSVTSFFGYSYRCRPVEEVLNEIAAFDHREPFFFVDDNIVGNPKFAKELFRGLILHKAKWFGQASVTIGKDDELLRLAAASGCIGLLIGFESISPRNLAAVGKRVNTVEEYEDIVRRIHIRGIGVHGFFVIGLDEDDEAAVERTVRFAQRMRLESAGFAFPTPLPGTRFYCDLERTGRIVTRDWSRYSDEVVFHPKRMSREALYERHMWASQEFYRLPSILRRIGRVHRHLALHWAVNLGWRSYYRERWPDPSVRAGGQRSRPAPHL
jgi:radical SAM superfamily enzyme YgiQ (UPF0313 family)